MDTTSSRARQRERQLQRLRDQEERERARRERQRAREIGRGSFVQMIEQVVAHILRGSPGPVPHILVGPVVPGANPRLCHFIVAGANCTFRVDQIRAPDHAVGKHLRAAVIAALVQRPPVIVGDIGNEPELARLREVVWPCERTRIREDIALERVAPGGAA